MSRHYTEDEKQHILAILRLNGGDIALTSDQTGIKGRTLYRWRQERDLSVSKNSSPLSPLSPFPPIQLPPLSDDDAEVLRDLQQKILNETYRLIGSIGGAIENKNTSLKDIVGALSQLIDRYVKLAAQLPPPEIEHVVQLAYEEIEDNDDHSPA